MRTYFHVRFFLNVFTPKTQTKHTYMSRYE